MDTIKYPPAKGLTERYQDYLTLNFLAWSRENKIGISQLSERQFNERIFLGNYHAGVMIEKHFPEYALGDIATEEQKAECKRLSEKWKLGVCEECRKEGIVESFSPCCSLDCWQKRFN